MRTLRQIDLTRLNNRMQAEIRRQKLGAAAERVLAPKRRRGKTPEGSLVAACLELLGSRRVFCWRNNTGCLLDRTGRPVRYGLVGSADIFAVVKGQLWAIECKVGHGMLTEAQADFGTRLMTEGGRYIVVRDSIDALAQAVEGGGKEST